MTQVMNVTPRRPLGIGGEKIAPGQSADVNISASKLKDHPFVREGWLHVDKGAPKASASSKGDDSGSESSGGVIE